jgi:hypothetical protein
MNLLAHSPDSYLAITVLIGVAALIAGYIVGHWFGKQDSENYIHTLRATLGLQAREIARLEKGSRKTQDAKETRRLSR